MGKNFSMIIYHKHMQDDLVICCGMGHGMFVEDGLKLFVDKEGFAIGNALPLTNDI